MTQPDRLRIAVFIDFDNIEIGVKNTLGAQFDAGLVLEALKERGEVVSKMAYSDWQRAGGYSRALTQHAIRMVQRNLTPGGDKNGADINLALDALEMAFTHPHINAFVIVGGDSDFISLVEKLKQYDKKVFVVGGRQFTSVIMQRNCHEFIAYENLSGASPGAGGGRRSSGQPARADRSPIEQVVPLVKRALKVLSERDVTPQLGLLKSTLLQLDSTFSEKSFGAGSFREFAQKLEKAGVLRVHQGKGGWMVGPADGSAPEAPADEGEAGAPAPAPSAASPAASPDQPRRPHPYAAAGTEGDEDAPVRGPAGAPADGVREFAQILGRASIRRWPLYLRNVKQIIRQTQADFDERAYGFANLTDLLRAAQKAGVIRIERDRQGVIRVFQANLAAVASAAAAGDDGAGAAEGVEDGEDIALAASAIGVPVVDTDDDATDTGDEAAGREPADEADEAEGERDEDEAGTGESNGHVAPRARDQADVDGNVAGGGSDQPAPKAAKPRRRRTPRAAGSTATTTRPRASRSRKKKTEPKAD
ncbi:MAG: NYN domain-containing protein [Vicinamibacterales bacterium]